MSSFENVSFQNQVNGILKIHPETSVPTGLLHMVQQIQFYHEENIQIKPRFKSGQQANTRK